MLASNGVKTLTLHVSGMHCSACPVLIESELTDLPEVSGARASLVHHHVEVTGEFGDKSAAHIAQDLSEVLKRHGYTLHPERQRHAVAWGDFLIAMPAAAVFVGLFVVMQQL